MSSAYELVMTKPRLTRAELGLPVDFYHGEEHYRLDISIETDIDQLYRAFFKVLEDGQAYPQETIDRSSFEKFFFAHYAFVVTAVDRTNEDGSRRAVAAFYIKPNFPGRSAHLANYGLLVESEFRSKGIGNFMVEQCIRLAKIIGYKALYTNLVYANNIASIKACERYGFQKVGCVPEAGNLKGIGYVDAFQFYKEL
ncbi:hypothetical protein BLOT_002516 [Blomia tropicalis]|nr:hypothetical protein BLOT_002516 [Blomia tropicalis]